ncbi:hypothetical protein ACFQFC_01475 [Amorphoplanes digitatis]|uniref:Uncharacterized protein n=1 Tax=Actinoplanes digitatis TaxID=1868 RepID=A0A7W7MQM1_9ACTN|nr:hypothetical protein [Actinoplanes digitatis]MBB4762847.1 hypothetical protein [Actinoplanes digitatis]
MATLLAVLATVTLAGCTDDPAPQPRPAAPSQAPSASATSTPPVRLKVPPAVAGEVARRVLVEKDGHPQGTTTVRRGARAGQEYWVHAACTSPTSGKTLSVEVRGAEPGASADALVAFEIPCDGTPTVNGAGELPAESVAVYLSGDQSDVSAYAVLAPTPSLPEGK